MKKLALLTFVLMSVIQINAQVAINTVATKEYQTITGIGGFGPQKVWWDSGPYYSQAYIQMLFDDLGLTMLRNPVPEGWEYKDDDGLEFDVNNESYDRLKFAGDANKMNLDGFNYSLGRATLGECKSGDRPYNDMKSFLFDMQAYAKSKNIPYKLIASQWSAPHWTKYAACLAHGDLLGVWNMVDNGMGPGYDSKNPIPQYDPNQNYAYDAKVVYNNDGNVYKYNIETVSSGHLPTETAYWIIDSRRNMHPEIAEELAGYVKALERDGIDLYAISLQNEPAFNEPYPSTLYSPGQYRDCMKEITKMWDKYNIKAKLFGAEDMGSGAKTYGWTSAVCDDATAGKYLTAVAVHGYTDGISASTGTRDGWISMHNTAATYNKELWMTETSGFNNNWNMNDGVSAYSLAKGMFEAFKYGQLSAWTFWYMCDNFGLQNLTPTKQYYVHKHYARYIRPGAIQIETSCSDPELLVMGFKYGAESRITYIIINNSSSTKTATFPTSQLPGTVNVYRTTGTENCTSVNNSYSNGTLTIPSSALVTVTFESSNHSPLIDVPSDKVIVGNNTNQTVNLTGISDGDNNTQTLTVTASSDSVAIVSNVSVVKNGSQYVLNYTPVTGANGIANITITVKDNGSNDILNTAFAKFKIKVIPFINHAPLIDQLPDQKILLKISKATIKLTGITDGDNNSQLIIGTVVSSSSKQPRSIRVNNVNGKPDNITFYTDSLDTYTITVTLKDNGGNDLGGNDIKTMSFKLAVVNSLNTNDITNENVLNLYPNPASNFINVSCKKELQGAEIKILNTSGVTVLSTKIIDNPMTISTENLPKGLYSVIVTTEKESYCRTFLKF